MSINCSCFADFYPQRYLSQSLIRFFQPPGTSPVPFFFLLYFLPRHALMLSIPLEVFLMVFPPTGRDGNWFLSASNVLQTTRKQERKEWNTDETDTPYRRFISTPLSMLFCFVYNRKKNEKEKPKGGGGGSGGAGTERLMRSTSTSLSPDGNPIYSTVNLFRNKSFSRPRPPQERFLNNSLNDIRKQLP